MEDIDELKREAEEAKERIKRDIDEVGDILKRIAEESGQMGKKKAGEATQQAEKWVEGLRKRVESRIEKAVTLMVGSSANSGGVVTREMDFDDFTNVEIGHAFDVEITRSDSYCVSITANEMLFDHINVTKSGNTLKISLEPLHFHMRPTLEARIAMPSLNKLRLAGAAKGVVTGFSSEECFALNLSGASSLDIDVEVGEAKFEISGASRISGNVKLGDVEFTLSGASRAELSGSANSAVLNAWGASKLDFADLALRDTDIHLKGASKATINVDGNLALDLSGCSKLSYIGNPTMRDLNVSGASTVHQK